MVKSLWLTLVYHLFAGYAGGSHYSHKGAASNFICLPEDPQWGDRQPTVNLAYVYGTEYESNLFGANVHQQDVPWSVCQAKKGRSSIMIPARTSCYRDWTLQYKGYLGAGYHNHAAATEYICVDENVQTVPGGFENKDGKLIYPVVSKCGSLRCNPYIDNKPLTCVVCSRWINEDGRFATGYTDTESVPIIDQWSVSLIQVLPATGGNTVLSYISIVKFDYDVHS